MSGLLWHLRWDARNLPRYFKRHGVLTLWRGSRSRHGIWSVQYASYVLNGLFHLARGGCWWRSNYAPPLWRELWRLAREIAFDRKLHGGRRLVKFRQIVGWWCEEQRYPWGQCSDCERDLCEDEREAYHNDEADEFSMVCFECYDPTPYEPDPYGGNGAY